MISVVIPCLNEEKALPKTLSSLVEQRHLSEVIIVDGGSDDNTFAVAKSYQDSLPSLTLINAARGRGSQMNAGAQMAKAEWLLFLHADTELPPDGLSVLHQAVSNRNIEIGCFRHRFSGQHWSLRLISLLHNWRFRMSGIIYGDQAMFVKRSLFLRLGGFPEQLVEDILFSEKAIQHRCHPRMLAAAVTTDSRKFEQIGVWRALAQVMCIRRQYRQGQAIHQPEFFRNYR